MAAIELKEFDYEMVIGEEDAHHFEGARLFFAPDLNDRIYWATLQDVKETQLAQR